MVLTLIGLAESLGSFCLLFPDIAADINSMQAAIQTDSLPLPSSAHSWLEPGRLNDGRSSTNGAASMLASDADHRGLSDWLNFVARLLTA